MYKSGIGLQMSSSMKLILIKITQSLLDNGKELVAHNLTDLGLMSRINQYYCS